MPALQRQSRPSKGTRSFSVLYIWHTKHRNLVRGLPGYTLSKLTRVWFPPPHVNASSGCGLSRCSSWPWVSPWSVTHRRRALDNQCQSSECWMLIQRQLALSWSEREQSWTVILLGTFQRVLVPNTSYIGGALRSIAWSFSLPSIPLNPLNPCTVFLTFFVNRRTHIIRPQRPRIRNPFAYVCGFRSILDGDDLFGLLCRSLTSEQKQ